VKTNALDRNAAGPGPVAERVASPLAELRHLSHKTNAMNESSDRYQHLMEKEKQFLLPSEHHHHEIEVAAYFKAEQRGFAPGHELDDWLEAEREYENRVAALNAE
jgi:hypothetical protein